MGAAPSGGGGRKNAGGGGTAPGGCGATLRHKSKAPAGALGTPTLSIKY